MAEADWESSAWQRLLELDLADVCRRSLAVQNRPGVLEIPFLTVSYHVDCIAKNVSGPEGVPPAEIQLVLLNYLLRKYLRCWLGLLHVYGVAEGLQTFDVIGP